MFHVYMLRSQSTGRFYVGSTGNLEPRLWKHGNDLATATRHRGPWRLVHAKAYATRREAMQRERYFETRKGRDKIPRLSNRGEEAS